MEINVQELEPCKLKVDYQIGQEEILLKRAEVVKMFRKAPVPGFREGKASDQVIKIHYKNQIEDSLKRALAEDAFHNTLFEKKIKPFGSPVINNLMLLNNKFNCEMVIHTKPEFEIPNYKEFEIPKPHSDLNVHDMSEKIMDDIRRKFGEVQPYDENDTVQFGDNVIVDYTGTVDGERVDQFCGEGEMIHIGNPDHKHFDEQIIGMKCGEVREFDIVVPEEGLASFKNKTIHFKAEISIGSKTVPAPLDDSLAKRFGKETLQELKIDVVGAASARVQEHEKKLLLDSLSKKLVAEAVIDVPSWMSISEAKYLASNAKSDWDKLKDEDKEQFIKMAEKNVKLSLLLDKLRDSDPDAQIGDQDVFDILKNNVARTSPNPEETLKEMNKTGYLQVLFSRIKDQYALDFLLKSVTIKE